MRTPFLAQCLCPQRHCILAIAFEREIEVSPEEALKAMISIALAADAPLEDKALLVRLGLPVQLNPWCALCGAQWETWKYEVGVLKERDFEKAIQGLREQEQAQQETAAALKAAGLAYDVKRN